MLDLILGVCAGMDIRKYYDATITTVATIASALINRVALCYMMVLGSIYRVNHTSYTMGIRMYHKIGLYTATCGCGFYRRT